MADKYPDFETLSQNERSGIDFGILVRQVNTTFAIVSPHGGGIEPGTSEIADGIATEDLSYYAFEGLKSEGNTDLHITSTRFDEPMCLNIIGQSKTVLTIHGEHSEEDGDVVFVGGRDVTLGRRLTTALRAKGFVVRRHPDRRLQGLEPRNICNRGTSGKGVQLELSRAVRQQMFRSLTREGRKHKKAKFRLFVETIHNLLKDELLT